jgi:hypothetical protein
MRLADAFRAKKRDEHYIVNCYIFAIGSLKSTESKMRESRLKLLLDYLKEAARILEPPRAAAFGGLSADGRPVQMTVVHNIDRPVRPAPPSANSAVRSDSAWPEEPISANAPFAAG